ncbi:hypothetical protein [Shinella oryzae]|uniref:hypothetical protein n=1 Tax=Shinella oryzae TaxID=2871820 RepID=UPI001FF5A92C|nr:hypothetical protein [Shinella oryzae]UPA24902.1 hypothetical protein K6301_01395 [Shinella oryzae]
MKISAALVMIAVLASPPVAQAQVFENLPGVVPSDATDAYSNKGDIVCEQKVDVRRSGSRHWLPRDVYVCEKNGISSSSTVLPPSSIRALRGLGY